MGILGYLLTKQNVCKGISKNESQSKRVLKQQYSFKYNSESGKTNKKWPQKGRLRMIEFHFFGMPIKTLGSLGKIRVGRVTGNTHIFFLALP